VFARLLESLKQTIEDETGYKFELQMSLTRKLD